MRADGGVCISEIVTSEIDVLPSEWSDVDEQRIWHGVAMATQGVQRSASSFNDRWRHWIGMLRAFHRLPARS
jgi:hypothetical protein